MKKKLKELILFTFVFLSFLLNFTLTSSLKISNFPENLTIQPSTEKTFQFTLEADLGNVTNISVNCSLSDQIGSCNSNCPSQLNLNESQNCSIKVKINQFTAPGTYLLTSLTTFNESGLIQQIQNQTQIIVPETPSLSLSISLENLKHDGNLTQELKVTNTGNVDLNVNLNGWIEDANGNEVNYFNLTFSETSFQLSVNQTKTIEVTIKANNASLGIYELNIQASFNGQTKKTRADFEVIFGYCQGTSDYITISISNEVEFKAKDFEPYDNFQIEVKVENDKTEPINTIVEAILIKVYELIEVSKVKEVLKVDANDYNRIKLEMEIPFLNEGKYWVYVRAYDDENETSCSQDSSYIWIVRPTHKIKLKKIYRDKDTYSCDEQLVISGEVVNIGQYDEGLIKLVYQDDLGNRIEDTFSLIEGESHNFVFTPLIPLNASETIHSYWLKIYYDWDSELNKFNKVDSYSYSFNVKGNCIKPEKNVDLFIDLQDSLIFNQTYKGKLKIRNIGDLRTTYEIEIKNWKNWLGEFKIEKTLITLDPNEEEIIEFELKPNQTGLKELNLIIKFDGKEKEFSKTIEIEGLVKGKYKKANWFDELRFEFERRPWLFYLVLGCIIVTLASLLALVIVLKRK